MPQLKAHWYGGGGGAHVDGGEHGSDDDNDGDDDSARMVLKMIVAIALMTTTSMMTLVAAVVVLSEATTNSVKILQPSLLPKPATQLLEHQNRRQQTLASIRSQHSALFAQDCSSRLQKLPATSHKPRLSCEALMPSPQ